MKAPEILNTCTEAIGTVLRTTIHLINGDRILTELDAFEQGSSEANATEQFSLQTDTQ